MTTDHKRFAHTTELVMAVLEGYAGSEAIAELEAIASEHVDCALGSVPACTCGQKEAKNFLQLFRGEIRGEHLMLAAGAATVRS